MSYISGASTTFTRSDIQNLYKLINNQMKIMENETTKFVSNYDNLRQEYAKVGLKAKKVSEVLNDRVNAIKQASKCVFFCLPFYTFIGFKMKPKISSGRLSYEPKFCYQDGVLIGNNWYEERQHYVTVKHKHETTNSQVYTPQGPCRVDPEIFWNYKIAGEGLGARCMMDHEGTKYHENYSTTYDIGYNVLPKMSKEHRKYNPRLQTFVPQQDYSANYGNTTQYGFKEKKRLLWKYESNTGTDSWISESHDTYQPPPKDAYTLKRRAVKYEFSSSMFEPNLVNVNWALKGSARAMVPDTPIDVIKRDWPHFYY